MKDVDLGNFGKKESEEPKYGGNGLFEHPELTEKELKSLKKNNYSEIKHKCDNVYTLQNKKNGRIVELRGVSALHACNLIGWRFRQVEVLSHYKISSNKNMHMLKELQQIRSNKFDKMDSKDFGIYGYAKQNVKDE